MERVVYQPVVECGMGRFPAGFQARGAHAAWSLSYILTGQVERLHSTGNHLARAETVSLAKPGYPSHWRVPAASEDAQIVWFIFTPFAHWAPLLAWPDASSGMAEINLAGSPLARQVRGALIRSYRISKSYHENRTALVLNAIEAALLFCQSAVSARHCARDPRVEAVIAYLLRHIDAPVSMQGAMRAACLSRSRLAELFKAETGMSVMEFIEGERMVRAQNLLSLTEMPIKEIARLVGFDDPAYFSRRFAGAYGKSPRVYREGVR